MDNIVEATREFKKRIEVMVGSSLAVVLSPHSITLSEEDLATLPCLVLQGPDVVFKERDYTSKSVKIGETVEGVNINEVKRTRTIYDLVFRVRLFTKRLAEALLWIGKLTIIFQKLEDVFVLRTDELIIFLGNDPVNIEIVDHGMKDGTVLTISDSSDEASLTNGAYGITIVDKDNVSVVFDGNGNGGTCSIEYIEYQYNVSFDNNFVSDTVPNFSDMKHYEASAVIEDVEIEIDEAEEVYESAGALNVDMP